MDHLSDFMQLTYVTSARTCTRSCYGRFMEPGPVQHCVHFKILILKFKATHGLAPKYIIELINIKPRSIYNLRSNQSLLLDPPQGKMLCHVT